jgi:hypothetical protein
VQLNINYSRIKVMKRIPYLISIMFLMISCSKGESMAESDGTFKITAVDVSTWEILVKERILFGHQSVGNNIIAGMNDLLREHPSIGITIKQTAEPEDMAKGTFTHFSVGKNENPISKIADFSSKIRQGLGKNVDVALFKFCFVDVDVTTDIDKLFREYKDAMSSLKKEYPDVIFIHVTVPLLRKEQTSFKGMIKNLIGRSDGFFSNKNNVKRNMYNELIMKEYAGKEPVFDLASIESTHSNGTRETFNVGGKVYYALAPEYTEDGGHLNTVGRKLVAGQFLNFLSHLN